MPNIGALRFAEQLMESGWNREHCVGPDRRAEILTVEDRGTASTSPPAVSATCSTDPRAKALGCHRDGTAACTSTRRAAQREVQGVRRDAGRWTPTAISTSTTATTTRTTSPRMSVETFVALRRLRRHRTLARRALRLRHPERRWAERPAAPSRSPSGRRRWIGSANRLPTNHWCSELLDLPELQVSLDKRQATRTRLRSCCDWSCTWSGR